MFRFIAQNHNDSQEFLHQVSDNHACVLHGRDTIETNATLFQLVGYAHKFSLIARTINYARDFTGEEMPYRSKWFDGEKHIIETNELTTFEFTEPDAELFNGTPINVRHRDVPRKLSLLNTANLRRLIKSIGLGNLSPKFEKWELLELLDRKLLIRLANTPKIVGLPTASGNLLVSELTYTLTNAVEYKKARVTLEWNQNSIRFDEAIDKMLVSLRERARYMAYEVSEISYHANPICGRAVLRITLNPQMPQ